MYVWDWVPVGYNASVECSVVSTGPPTAVPVGHEMEGGQPWSLNASGCTVLQHDIELGLGCGQVIRGKTAWAAGYWWARCCTNVVDGVVPDLSMYPRRFDQPREFL